MKIIMKIKGILFSPILLGVIGTLITFSVLYFTFPEFEDTDYDYDQEKTNNLNKFYKDYKGYIVLDPGGGYDWDVIVKHPQKEEKVIIKELEPIPFKKGDTIKNIKVKYYN